MTKIRDYNDMYGTAFGVPLRKFSESTHNNDPYEGCNHAKIIGLDFSSFSK